MFLKLAKTTDAELVKEYQQHHNKQAFGKLYERYLNAVYGFVYSRVGNQQSAEEITSDTFLTLIDVIDKYQPQASQFKTFVLGIALNKIRQHWQKLSRHKQVQLEEEWLIEAPVPQERSEEEQQYQYLLKTHMKHILEMLSEQYRSVLLWRFIKGYSIKETALALNITEQNVKVRQNRALKKAQQLAKEVLHASS